MKRLGLVVSTFAVAAFILGCPLLKKKKVTDEDASAELADAATIAPEGLGAKNEADVLRYASEVPLNNEPAVIGSSGAKVHNFPLGGPEIAHLPPGTAVAKIAQYFSTGVLIMFDDLTGDGTKVMGWVAPKVFDVAAPPPTKTVFVPPPTRKDASAPVVHDAGGNSVAVVDAGGSKVAVVDAGGGKSSTINPPPPPKGAIAVPPTNGKCPDGWTLTQSMCRRKCAADAECPRGTKCLVKSGTKVCSSDN